MNKRPTQPFSLSRSAASEGGDCRRVTQFQLHPSVHQLPHQPGESSDKHAVLMKNKPRMLILSSVSERGRAQSKGHGRRHDLGTGFARDTIDDHAVMATIVKARLRVTPGAWQLRDETPRRAQAVRTEARSRCKRPMRPSRPADPPRKISVGRLQVTRDAERACNGTGPRPRSGIGTNLKVLN